MTNTLSLIQSGITMRLQISHRVYKHLSQENYKIINYLTAISLDRPGLHCSQDDKEIA